MKSSAILSPCRRYRYLLERTWSTQPHALFVMLNPSTADENANDRTIDKCIKYCQRWGHGSLRVVNLFAWRATDPKDMMGAQDPIGPDNDRIIAEQAAEAGIVIAAWGASGSHMGRADKVLAMLPVVHALHKNKDGSPGHPLYLKGAAQPFFIKGTHWVEDWS